MPSYTVKVTSELAEQLRFLAERHGRWMRHEAQVLLAEAIRNAARGDSVAALAAAFEAEGQRWFAQADRHSTSLTPRLLLQTRGEAWFQAAARLRAAISDQARTVLPADDRPTAA